MNLPNKILHVLSRALPADNRSKARVCVQCRVLAATPIYEPVKLYDGGFRYLMNERAASLSTVILQEPGFLSPNLRREYCVVNVYWCKISRSRKYNPEDVTGSCRSWRMHLILNFFLCMRWWENWCADILNSFCSIMWNRLYWILFCKFYKAIPIRMNRLRYK